MHILLIPSWYATAKNPIRGSFFYDQAHALQKAGHKVGMLVPPTKLRSRNGLTETWQHWRQSNRGIDIYEDRGVPVYRIHWWGWIPAINPYQRIPLAYRVFDRYCREMGKPDIIHSHSILYGGYLGAHIGKKYNIPTVLTEHSTNYQDRLILPGQGAITKFTLEHTDRCYTVGDTLAQALQRYLPEKAIGILDNIVDVDFFQPPPTPPPAQPFVFVMIATLTRRKAHPVLLKAFAQAFRGEPVLLRIAGNGYSGKKLDRLRQQISDLGIFDQVELCGLLSRDDLLHLLQQGHSLVSSSYTEGFGVTLIEAMACGKPVVATRSGGPEHFVTADNGILVEPGDPQALAAAMQQMVDHYEHYDGQEIRQQCVDRFGETAITKQLLSIYNQLLNAEHE